MSNDELADKVNYQIESVAFDGPTPPYRGFTIKASHLKEPHAGDALIEIFRDGKSLRSFLWPAYKIYNLRSHFKDIVDGELENSDIGYQVAAWNGISNAVFIVPKEKQEDKPT